MLKPIRDTNDLGHPLCDNLRSGDWLPGYTVDRLKLKSSTKGVGDILSLIFSYLSSLPRYLIPCYFDAIISKIYQELIAAAQPRMSQYVSIDPFLVIYLSIPRFVQKGSSFISDLAMGSVQLYGNSASATLPLPLPSSSKPPSGSLAAGLPHFSTGYMRCWGRDTFIALRGLMLVTGRYQEAK